MAGNPDVNRTLELQRRLSEKERELDAVREELDVERVRDPDNPEFEDEPGNERASAEEATDAALEMGDYPL